MATNTINQGAVNGIVIKPIWGTLDKQEEEDSVDRFIAIVDSIKKLLDSKADIDHNHDDRYYTKTEIDTKLWRLILIFLKSIRSFWRLTEIFLKSIQS